MEEYTVFIFFYPEDGSITFFQNLHNHLPRYMASHPRKLQSQCSPLWGHQVLQFSLKAFTQNRVLLLNNSYIVYFMQYISVYNATYYQSPFFSQHVLAIYGHQQVSTISLKLLHCMVCQNFHILCRRNTSQFKINWPLSITINKTNKKLYLNVILVVIIHSSKWGSLRSSGLDSFVQHFLWHGCYVCYCVVLKSAGVVIILTICNM
jgi:hypothetical protein